MATQKIRRWPKGTWMRLISPQVLRAFVGPDESEGQIMSARRLARAIGCHPSFIDHLLAGRKSSCEAVTAQRIAEALGIPLKVLFVPNVPSASKSSASRGKATTTREKAAAA